MVLIRDAIKADHKTITSFQVAMAWETEKVKLEFTVTEQGVKAVLDDPSKGRYFIAETENEIAGCLLLTYEWSDWRNGMVLWIQSVYVSMPFRGRGVFRSLFGHIKQMVENNNSLKGIRLYVDKTNEKAIRVYRRCGMDGEHYQVFEWIRPA